MSENEEFRCGLVAFIGRPNAGKSTLMNQILGSKLAITSAKPQTTRDRIMGIYTDDRVQAIMVDTPGVHRAWTELNKHMVRRAFEALRDVDVAFLLADLTTYATRLEHDQELFDAEDTLILDELAESSVPLVLVANKVDVIPKPLVLPIIQGFASRLELAAAVPVSALTGDGVPALVGELIRLLPVHPPLYDPDDWTNVTERFLVAEIIREKVFHLTAQEIPYSTWVEVERFDETERHTKGIVRIYARISLERSSQKGIVIGRRGAMLKRIGTMARKEIQALLDCRVYLELYVNVEKDWSRSRRGLKRVGFDFDA